MRQDLNELNASYATPDPWGYETNPHDAVRKRLVLGHLEGLNPERTLDIGCGHGFVTRDLPGGTVWGVDVSVNAIAQARQTASPRHRYEVRSLFELNPSDQGTFDLILITGVLYEQYIGRSLPLVYLLMDRLLRAGGTLVSVHIDEWYSGRFPYPLTRLEFHPYREFIHRHEVYVK